jgi:ornithine carbamoyltransferase
MLAIFSLITNPAKLWNGSKQTRRIARMRRMLDIMQQSNLVLHCLSAHRGEEVSADVIDGPQSVVRYEAENRMHAQKALMEYLLLG